MNSYSWTDIREPAAEEFGAYPDAALEQEILEVFRERPAFVVSAIAEVRRGFAAGRVHSPWLLLRKALRSSPANEIVNDESERNGAVARAEGWLRRTGLHIDRESELLDELFGERGMLRAWASDKTLRERLTDLWCSLRPLGERVELEALERAATRRAIREKLAAKRAERLNEDEPDRTSSTDAEVEEEWASA